MSVYLPVNQMYIHNNTKGSAAFVYRCHCTTAQFQGWGWKWKPLSAAVVAAGNLNSVQELGSKCRGKGES